MCFRILQILGRLLLMIWSSQVIRVFRLLKVSMLVSQHLLLLRMMKTNNLPCCRVLPVRLQIHAHHLIQLLTQLQLAPVNLFIIHLLQSTIVRYVLSALCVCIDHKRSTAMVLALCFELQAAPFNLCTLTSKIINLN